VSRTKRRNRRSRLLRTFPLRLTSPLPLAGLAGLLILVSWLSWGLFLPRHPLAGGEWFFEVKAGESLAVSARRLARQDVINSSLLFRVMSRLRGADTRVRAGEYRITKDKSGWAVLSQFLRGEVFLHKFTVPEGTSVAQIAAELERRGLADGQGLLAVAKDTSLVEALGLPGGKLEGYLFPDTYRIPRGITPVELIGMMLERFRERLPDDFQQAAKRFGLKSSQLIILASIIEREAKGAAEMPLVAAVFHNRLAKRMRLESCATIQYVLGYQKQRLLEKDLAIPSAYNTYLHRGLPPGAVCNPGAAALKAAAAPAEVPYLYFVSRGDGRHEFSVDYQAHLAAKEKYQAR